MSRYHETSTSYDTHSGLATPFPWKASPPFFNKTLMCGSIWAYHHNIFHTTLKHNEKKKMPCNPHTTTWKTCPTPHSSFRKTSVLVSRTLIHTVSDTLPHNPSTFTHQGLYAQVSSKPTLQVQGAVSHTLAVADEATAGGSVFSHRKPPAMQPFGNASCGKASLQHLIMPFDDAQGHTG